MPARLQTEQRTATGDKIVSFFQDIPVSSLAASATRGAVVRRVY
jgi:hypothetical protein